MDIKGNLGGEKAKRGWEKKTSYQPSPAQYEINWNFLLRITLDIEHYPSR
jgi:hypothetical protein